MEDWEQFFLEKSRRRFDKEQRRVREQRIKTISAAVLAALLVICAIVALGALR